MIGILFRIFFFIILSLLLLLFFIVLLLLLSLLGLIQVFRRLYYCLFALLIMRLSLLAFGDYFFFLCYGLFFLNTLNTIKILPNLFILTEGLNNVHHAALLLRMGFQYLADSNREGNPDNGDGVYAQLLNGILVSHLKLITLFEHAEEHETECLPLQVLLTSCVPEQRLHCHFVKSLLWFQGVYHMHDLTRSAHPHLTNIVVTQL